MAKLTINHDDPLIHIQGKLSKLLTLLVLCLITGGVFTLIGGLLVEPIFGESILGLQNMESASANSIKFLQLFSSIGLFVFPGILFAIFFIDKPMVNLKLTKEISAWHFLMVALLLYSFLPLVNWTVEFNNQLELPEYLSRLEQWMKNSENRAMELTRVFLKMENWGDLTYNILLIGIIPAVGEELIFRGIIQQTINKEAKNYHIGIWISAILFSAMHLQFYGFIPRMLLGAFFGYLLVWSKNLWVPIFAHFLNNTTAVLIAYFVGVDTIENDLDKIGTTEDTYLVSIVSLVIFSSLLRYYYRRENSLKKQ